jgi:hypothetical protein
MNNQDDAVFIRNFALVLLALCVIAIGAFVLARIVNSGAMEAQGQAAIEHLTPARSSDDGSLAGRVPMDVDGPLS